MVLCKNRRKRDKNILQHKKTQIHSLHKRQKNDGTNKTQRKNDNLLLKTDNKRGRGEKRSMTENATILKRRCISLEEIAICNDCVYFDKSTAICKLRYCVLAQLNYCEQCDYAEKNDSIIKCKATLRTIERLNKQVYYHATQNKELATLLKQL